MKNTLLRRLLPVVMLAAMLLTAVPAAAAFRDTAGHWAEKTLDEWQDEGLIDGCGDGSFRPDGTMTRAEFAKLVNRAMGFTAESAISFSDVTERDWFHAEVARAAAAGYAQGSGGAFRPNQPVTRAEAAAMLARAAGLAANEERADAFTDAASIPAWARGSVGAAAASGYMNGYPDGAFGALDPQRTLAVCTAAFSDVPEGAWYADAVRWAAEHGIAQSGTGRFAPNAPCTRAEMVTFLYRAAGCPKAVRTESGFADVSGGGTLERAVCWAVENGVTNGTGEGRFSPDDTCTRAQAAAFLHRALGLPEGRGDAAFSDVREGAWYADAVRWAVGAGVTNGVGEGRFAPNEHCTRAQIVTFLWRVYNG